MADSNREKYPTEDLKRRLNEAHLKHSEEDASIADEWDTIQFETIAKLHALMDKVQSRNEEYLAEEVDHDVQDAIREIRQKNHRA